MIEPPSKSERAIRFLKILALVLFCVGFPVLIWVLARFAYLMNPTMGVVPSNAEVVTTVLAGLAISIGVLATTIGLFSIWGYHSIKDEAREVARRHSQKAIDDELLKLREGTELAYSQPVDTFGTINTGEENQKVGEPYKKDER